MAPKKPASKKTKAGFVIGSARYRKISAVEGIEYSSKIKAASSTTGKTLSPQERRKAIIEAYRKA
ncbi:hypothetical protein [Bradyrhizobium sp. SRS-191]|uniref:hypothetical protein n=1 Tax=Bradyrhizobium sp. SRS-191 TaxID=2962606 RepID=UPI00211E6B01|nr:hypothetical protein [Bradyrhizobium sp. SRS-191]